MKPNASICVFTFQQFCNMYLPQVSCLPLRLLQTFFSLIAPLIFTSRNWYIKNLHSSLHLNRAVSVSSTLLFLALPSKNNIAVPGLARGKITIISRHLVFAESWWSFVADFRNFLSALPRPSMRRILCFQERYFIRFRRLLGDRRSNFLFLRILCLVDGTNTLML